MDEKINKKSKLIFAQNIYVYMLLFVVWINSKPLSDLLKGLIK